MAEPYRGFNYELMLRRVCRSFKFREPVYLEYPLTQITVVMCFDGQWNTKGTSREFPDLPPRQAAARSWLDVFLWRYYKKIANGDEFTLDLEELSPPP